LAINDSTTVAKPRLLKRKFEEKMELTGTRDPNRPTRRGIFWKPALTRTPTKRSLTDTSINL